MTTASITSRLTAICGGSCSPGRIARNEWELNFYELALKVSGAVQAARWTSLPNGLGYIHSFNGSHSLFIDTMRTLRVCGIAHQSWSRACWVSRTKRVNLLARLLEHAQTSAQFNIYYGEGRDTMMCRSSVAAPCTRPSSIRRAALSLPIVAAGIFAVHHMDARAWHGRCWDSAEQLEFMQSLAAESEFGSRRRSGKE